MEKREIQEGSSETDRLTNTQKSMPTDLLLEISLRSPAKSIAKFRCASKQWASILRRRDFLDQFQKRSLTRPRFLFTFDLKCKSFFLSAPQPFSPDQNSSPLVADRHMSFHTRGATFGISRPVGGWICSHEKTPMVANPSTGEYITLPKVTTWKKSKRSVQHYLVYDPIDKIFKVLRVSKDFQVLTLGTGELSWRMINFRKPHSYCLPGGICINGVLYYSAARNDEFGHYYILVCFDVRSEKFKGLLLDDPIGRSTLINCKGKLGAVHPVDSDWLFSGTTTSLELWVLEDAEDEKWSTHIYEFPPSWRDIAGDNMLYVAGMTSNGEIVLSIYGVRDPFYIVYYNVEKNSMVRVEINLEGVVAAEGDMIYTFMDHFEDVKLREEPTTS